MGPMPQHTHESRGSGSRPPTSVSAWGARGAWVGCVTGVLVALLDGLIIEIWDMSSAFRVLSYAMATDVLCAGVLGALVGIVLALPRKLVRRPVLADLPLAIAVATGLTALTGDIFEGDWVRTQSWAASATWLLPILQFAALLLLMAATRRILAARAPLRRVFALTCLGVAALIPLFALRSLGAYPGLQTEGAIVSMGIVAVGLLLVLPRDTGAWRPALWAVAAVAASISFLVHARADRSVHVVRSEIVSRPLFISRAAMTATEQWLLDKVRPIERGLEGTLTAKERAALLNASPSPRRTTTRERATAKNVIWIALDTLRADHVSCLGYSRPTTPNIDRFAKSSWVYQRATTPCPMSLYAYSSTLNGVAPRNSPAYQASLTDGADIPEGFSMPEVLRNSGFATMAVTAFSKGFQSSGGFKTFRRGFERFVATTDRGFRADQVVDRGLEILEALAEREAPFFVWLHFMDIHAPYEFHPEFPFGDLPMDAYDSEIAFDDAQVGRLLKGLDDLGLSKDTVVILFADHGEAFGEHNLRHHGASLHQHQIHVPLMIREPRGTHGRIGEWVSLSDLAPTTLSYLGIPDAFQRFGRDIRPSALDRSPGIDARYSEIPVKGKNTSRERCVVSGNLKLIWKPLAGTFQVFDLVEDPAESRNILDFDAEPQKRLMALLRAYDESIESFWKQPGDAAPSPRASSGPSRITGLVSRLETSGADDERLRTLADLGQLLSSSASKWWDYGSRALLGASSIDRLRVVLQRIVADAQSSPQVLDRACWLLTYFDTPETARFLAQHAHRIRSGGVALDVANLRARHGDARVKTFLSEKFEKVHAAARLRIAAALAHLGDDRGRDLLRMALYAPSLRTVREAVSALGALGDHSCLDVALFSHGKLWRDATLLRALLPSALADTTSRGHAALLMLANAARQETATAAKRELGRRFDGRFDDTLKRVWESIYGAKGAVQYGQDHLAIRYFRGAGPSHDDLMGPFLWLLLRAHWAVNDEQGAAGALDRLRRVAPEGTSWSRLADQLTDMDFGNSEPCPRAQDVSLEVRVIDEGIGNKPGELGFSLVEVVNTGDRFIPGGAGPRLPWFEWVHVGDDGRRRRGGFAVRLSADGLAPGRAARILVPIRRPKTPGTFRPILLFGTRSNRKAAKEILVRDSITVAD